MASCYVVAVAAALLAGPAPTPSGLGSQPVTEAQHRLLGPMAGELLNRVGIFDVRAELQLKPTARPVTIAARAEGRIIGNRWLVTELRGADGERGMIPFEGLGVNGYDPEARSYVGYWVDGSRGIAVPVKGTYDDRTGVFTTMSTERRSDGSTVQVRSETKRTSPDTEVTTFWAPDADGRPFIRMVLTFTRAKDAK